MPPDPASPRGPEPTSSETLSSLRQIKQGKQADPFPVDDAPKPPAPSHPPPAQPPPAPGRTPLPKPIPASARRKPIIPARAPKPVREPRQPISLEQFLGAKAFAAAGSLIVVVGVVLFLKFAYDQGWIGKIPEVVRCLMGAAFGLALIGAGEGVRKKIGAFASSGLTATGLATLYATVLVARHMFELFGPTASFFLLVGVTLTGIVLSTRGRRLFTAYISLAGAYAVPFIVGATDPTPAVLPMYLIALLVFGLALAAGMGGVFRSLRPTVWGATALIGGLWIVTMGTEHLWTATVFLTVVWCVVHLELCITILARRSSWKPVSMPRIRDDDFVRWLTGIPEPSVSFSATVWAAISAIYVVRSVDASWQAVPAFVLAMACSLLVWRLSPTLDVLRGVVISAGTALGSSLCLQAAGLIIAGVALQFSGNDQDLAWLVLGAVGCIIGRRLEARPLVVYGLITLGILGARLLLERSMLSSADMVSFGPLTGSYWTVKAIALGIGLVVAGLCSDLFGRQMPRVLTGLALALFMFIPTTPGAEPAAVAIVWVVLAFGAFAASGGKRWLDLDSMAAVVVTLASIPALIAFAEVIDGSNLRSLFVGACVFTLGAQFCFAALIEQRHLLPGWRNLRLVPAGAATVLLCVLFIGPETPPSAIAAIWAAVAAGLIGVGWRKGWLELDLFGAFLSGAALLPWGVHLIADHSAIDPFLTNATFGSALAVNAAMWFGAYSLLHAIASSSLPREQRMSMGHALGAMGGLLLLASTSIEANRAGQLYFDDETARQAVLSIWWAIFGVFGLVFGSIQKMKTVRLACLILIGLSAVKVVVYDLANVSPIWRIASSMALGLLMLLIGVAYAKSLQRGREGNGDYLEEAPPSESDAP